MTCNGEQATLGTDLASADTRIDLTGPDAGVRVASPAGIYDCYLRGASHLSVDMDVERKVLRVAPYARTLARANRKFALRAAHLMARRGITQFLDLGCGLDGVPPYVHETVCSVSPGAHVLYVDNDRDVAINNPALTAGTRASFMRADITQPDSLLTKAEDYEFIDLSQPMGVLLCAVLHFITYDQAYLIVPALKEEMVAGSYLAISHVTSTDTDPKVQGAIEEAYMSASAPAVFRKRHEISAFFEGWQLVKPGLIEVTEWRGNGQAAPARSYGLKILCGVARKT